MLKENICGDNVMFDECVNVSANTLDTLKHINIKPSQIAKKIPKTIQNKTTKQTFIQSPLNYTGSKSKLLPQILPLFPKNINTMLDLFCGGAVVGINTSCKRLILNDKSAELIGILEMFKNINFEKMIEKILNIIYDFRLSDSQSFGYAFYHCNSSNGLSSYNKEGFLNLRKSYNNDKNLLKLFVLIIFAFNNQIRFNAKGEFNLPCGKRDFNAKMRLKLKGFIEALQHKNIILTKSDFRDFDISILDSKSLVYIDPPYLLGIASYNENNAWNEQNERDLLTFIDKLNAKGIKFAFSNVLTHKGKEHITLKQWLKSNPQYHIHYLNFSYKNCNYHTKKLESREVLIRNYEG